MTRTNTTVFPLWMMMVFWRMALVWESEAFTPPTRSSFLSQRPSMDTTSAGVATTSATTTTTTSLYSSFFGSFEEFEDPDEDDEDDDDDEDDEFDDFDGASVAAFRANMKNLFDDDDKDKSDDVDELIRMARAQSGEATEAPITDWAHAVDDIRPGIVLVANPAKFCATNNNNNEGGVLGGLLASGPSPSLLAKFGLTRPPPKDLGADRQADLLPVLVLVERDDRKGCRGVLLNRRTGYLLGDLEQPASAPESGDSSASNVGDNSDVPPILEKFCIQPLWFGGIDNVSSGLDMLHLCPTVTGAQKLTDDGLYWGGDPAQAQDAMEDPSLDRVMTGFDFKFFVQSTIWSTKDLDKQIKDGVWFPASVSQQVLFKSRDRMGTQTAKPLWTEIMDLMGGEFQQIRDEFYGEETTS